MAQTKEGAAKAVAALRAKYGEDYFANIGSKGGKVVNDNKGFGFRWACKCDLVPGTHITANCAGKKGGVISRRGAKNYA